MAAGAEWMCEGDLPVTDRLVRGRVSLREGATLAVSLESGSGEELVARRAASCLLAPQPGDRVLVALGAEPFVVAVLEQEDGRPAEVIFAGDAHLRATGKLRLGCGEELQLTARRGVGIGSEQFDVKAKRGSLVFGELRASAGAALWHIARLGVVAKVLDAAADSVVSRVKRSFRFVEEQDQVRARHLDYRADQTAQLRGEMTVVVARQVAKIDGEQVHIG